MPAHGREADAAPEAIARARGLVEFLNANAERIEAVYEEAAARKAAAR